MFNIILIGAALVVLTILIHAIGSTVLVRYLAREQGRKVDRPIFHSWVILIRCVMTLIALHMIQILLWAVAYVGFLPDGELASFESAVYFSMVTFTTVGYGDVTLIEGWRLLSGIEALNGIILLGWSTAMIFAVVQGIWRKVILKQD
ncbi:MAG: potassium channel family protein [Pseudomonadota bacterium]